MNILKNNYSLAFLLIIFIIGFIMLKLVCINETKVKILLHNKLQLVGSWQGDFKTRQFSTVDTDHYQIRYLPIDKAYTDMVAQVAEEAYRQVSDAMQHTPSKTIKLTIYPDTKTLAKNYGWDKDEKAMGVYWAGNIGILSPRVWTKGENDLQQFKDNGPLVHEFAHLLVDEITKGNYNRWWTEGVAQYIEKKLIYFEFAKPNLLNDKKYYSFSEMEKDFDNLDQSIVYWQSLKAVEYIVSVYGENAIYVIMNNLGNGDSMPVAINKTLNLDFETFAKEYYKYLERA